MDEYDKKTVKIVLRVVFAVVCIFLFFGFFYTISAGERGIVVTLGNPSDNYVSGGEEYVQLQAIDRWNGILPVVTGGSIPLINLNITN